MKFDWTVTVALHYLDKSSEQVSDVWEGLTVAEADAKAGEMVSEHMRGRKAVGITVTARAQGKRGTPVVTKTEWK